MAAAAISISASSPSHLLHIPKKPPKHFQLSKPTTTTNNNNIPILLQQSVQTNNIHLATATHAQILKHPNNPTNTYFFNTLITSYFKLGLSSYAYRVFQNVQNPDVVTFTSMVSWLAKCLNEYEAVDMFVQMMRCGVDPNEYSFVAVLTACGRVFDIDLGSQVHGLVVKMGVQNDVFVMNALMGFYGKCGCLDLAVKMFDEMSERDVSSWNTVVSCFVKESMFGEALDIFREMVGTDGVGIDHFSISAVLTACSEHDAVMEGREVHARAIKFGWERNLSVGNALIGFYNKCGNVKNAVSLFDRMVVKDVITWTQMISFYMELGHVDMAEEVFNQMPERNCVSYNSLLSGFCQNGDGVQALRMFCRMLEEGVQLDEYSLAIIMNACGLHEDKTASEQIHGFVLKFGCGSNDRVESALLDMCTKCERMSDAEEMFNSNSITQNSSFIWTSMICGYARNGSPYEALSLFFKGQSENTMIIDEMVLTTVLGLCATLGFDRIGEQIHSSALRSGMLSDIKVENALIGMYSKCGNMAAAIKVFDNMKRLDIVSWNSLMSGYIFNKQGDKALDLWAVMKMTNIKPDSITTLLIVSAYTHTTSNMVKECYRFFQSMKTTYNIEPTSEHYVSLVHVFGHWGLLNEAEDIIKKMPFEPNTYVWRALLDNCRTPINTDIGKRAAKEILSKKPNDPSTYILVSNLYSASGRWNCSETIREEMREKGIQKRPGKSWIIHENKVHSFYARDNSHTHSKDIYSGLDILVLKCLKAGYVPDTSFVLHEVEEHQKRDFLYNHSAKLAVTYGLLMTKGTPVRVMKNILLCGDCHTFFKYASAVTKRDIHIRDASGFHCFVNGECSCKRK